MKRITTLTIALFFACAVMVLAQDPPAEPAGPDAGAEPVKSESVVEKAELSIEDVTEILVDESIAQMKKIDPDMPQEELERHRFDTAVRLCENYWNAAVALVRSELLLKQITAAEERYRKALALPEGDALRNIELEDSRKLLLKNKSEYLDLQKSYIDGIHELLATMVNINPLVCIDRKIVLSSSPYIPPNAPATIEERKKFFTPELLKKDMAGVFNKRDLAGISIKLKVIDTYFEEYLKSTNAIRALRKKIEELEKKHSDKTAPEPLDLVEARKSLAEENIAKMQCAADIDRIIRYLNFAEKAVKATEKGDGE